MRRHPGAIGNATVEYGIGNLVGEGFVYRDAQQGPIRFPIFRHLVPVLFNAASYAESVLIAVSTQAAVASTVEMVTSATDPQAASLGGLPAAVVRVTDNRALRNLI
ncbi:hypothetical protein NKH73_26660 [Mesorhizobium sp. M0938]|uniref:hypothetical protein n=1 Tax=unclassified Mesorhizobium TaxID=325217 RepID=UPI003335A307